MIPALCQHTLIFIGLTSAVCQAQGITAVISKDVIVLVNHDRLTGEIMKGNQGTIHFDSNHAGIVSIDVEDVVRIETGIESQFLFLFQDNSFITGRLMMNQKDSFSVITNSGDTLIYQVSDLIGFSRYDSQWYKRINGYVSLGYSFTKASALGRANANYSFGYALKQWNFVHTLSIIYSSEVNGPERIDTDIAAVFNVTSRWAIIDYLKYQKIQELNLKGRTLNIVAIGNRLIAHRSAELLAASGISIQDEASVSENKHESQAEVPILIKLSLFDLNKPKIELTSTSIGFFGLTDPGRFRLDHKSNLSFEMWRDFQLSLEFYYNFDNHSFDERRPYDLGLLVNAQYEF